MIVLLNVAPLKLVPLVLAFRRFALLRSAEEKLARVRLALVRIAPKKSPLLKLPRDMSALPKLAPSKIESEQTTLLRLALMKFAFSRNTDDRFVPCKSLTAPKFWLRICQTNRDFESRIVVASICVPVKSTKRMFALLKLAPRK